MPFLEEPQFKGPIPGQGMTAEPQARPWSNPPQYSTVEEALEFYIPRLQDTKAMDGMIDAMEKEIPITVLAETLTTGGVMQGLHTIDVATLVNPVIVEFLKGIAENADIEYDLGDVTVKDEEVSESMLERVMAKSTEEPTEEIEKEEEEIIEDKPVGLMSKREVLI